MPIKLAFALEHSLGHVTHAQNLKRVVDVDATVEPTYIDIDFHDQSYWASRLPGVRSNWSARASLMAYRALRARAHTLDAVLFHTQVTALFSAGLMRRLPAVISLDATPLQYDALGASYGHVPSGSARLEALKKRLNQRAFNNAKRLVTWSQWAKDSLVTDYGVPADKITVIPPGIDTREQWNFPRGPRDDAAFRLLFVGGDFERKGGDTLLKAIGDLPAALDIRLDIVTKATGIAEGMPRVTVYNNLSPNSDKLRQLFAKANLFVFPTRGDCLPLAVMEALAASLPIVTTSVGALPEAVRHQETGLIVPPDDPRALGEAIVAFAQDKERCARMSACARQTAVERFDAATNYRLLVDTVKSVARQPSLAGQMALPTSSPR